MLKKLRLVLKGRNMARVARERARRERIIAARQTDYRRWHDPASYNASWETRLDTAMPMLADARWVADLGCGMQDLRKRLAPGTIYLPMDIKRWTDDTLLCDLNAKQLPDLYISLCDVCVILGVLEYVYEPEWLLARLAEHAESLVLSYNAADLASLDRAGHGWVNAFDTGDILGMVERTPYRVATVAFHGAQMLVKATRRDFDAACREQREARRRAFRAEGASPVATPAGQKPAEVTAAGAGGTP